jgi:glycosyltransferase involved in cell wall biosynthesis
MRVLHVIPSIAPQRGGPTYVLAHLTRALRDAGVATDVLATTADLDAGSRTAALQAFAGSEVELIPTRGPVRLDLAPGFASAVRRRLRDVDLVHVHTVFTYPVVVTPLLCQLAGRPYIIRTVGTLDQACINHRSSWQKRLLLGTAGRRNLLRAAAVHVTSAMESRQVAALFPTARLSLVELGVQLDVDVAPARPGRGSIIGCLGRVHPIKRIEVLLRALRSLPTARLRVAGTGEGVYLERLRQLAIELSVSDRVEWLGHIDGGAKRAFLAACDVLSFPSEHESFGIAVAEAMAAGRPVVVAPDVGLADDVRAHDAGSVCEPAPERFAQAISTLLEDDTLRARQGSNARALALGRWSWREVAARTIEMYRAALTTCANGRS